MVDKIEIGDVVEYNEMPDMQGIVIEEPTENGIHFWHPNAAYSMTVKPDSIKLIKKADGQSLKWVEEHKKIEAKTKNKPEPKENKMVKTIQVMCAKACDIGFELGKNLNELKKVTTYDNDMFYFVHVDGDRKITDCKENRIPAFTFLCVHCQHLIYEERDE